MRVKTQHCFLVLLYALVLSVQWAWAAPQSDFSLGVVASKQGLYEEAIRYFLKAEKAGKRTATLYHNLGVAYFQTGNYDAARAAFLKVGQSQKLAALGFYNVGLVEEKQNNDAQAQQWFRKARASARTEKLRQLVDLKLAGKSGRRIPFVAYVEMVAGSDSNPQLADDTIAQVEKERSSFIGTIAYGRYHFNGDAREGSYVSGTAFLRRYSSVEDEDIRFLSVAGGYIQTVGKWSLDYQLGVNQLLLGGERVQDGVVGSVLGRRNLAGASYLDARLMAEDVSGDSGNGYDYLSGNTYQLRLRYGGSAGIVNWSLRYEASADDRGELISRAADGAIVERYSASPVRHDIRLDLLAPLGRSVDAEFKIGLRNSDFRDEKIRQSIPQGVRDDDLRYASVGVAYHFASAWTAKCELSYWDNTSNFDRYEYQRSELALSVSRSFY